MSGNSVDGRAETVHRSRKVNGYDLRQRSDVVQIPRLRATGPYRRHAPSRCTSPRAGLVDGAFGVSGWGYVLTADVTPRRETDVMGPVALDVTT